jgi:hypothetical protein
MRMHPHVLEAMLSELELIKEALLPGSVMPLAMGGKGVLLRRGSQLAAPAAGKATQMATQVRPGRAAKTGVTMGAPAAAAAKPVRPAGLPAPPAIPLTSGELTEVKPPPFNPQKLRQRQFEALPGVDQARLQRLSTSQSASSAMQVTPTDTHTMVNRLAGRSGQTPEEMLQKFEKMHYGGQATTTPLMRQPQAPASVAPRATQPATPAAISRGNPPAWKTPPRPVEYKPNLPTMSPGAYANIRLPVRPQAGVAA